MKRFNILLILAALSLPNMTKAQSSLYENEFPLSDVKLLDSPFKSAMDRNGDVLRRYVFERLMAPFFIEAGLEPKG